MRIAEIINELTRPETRPQAGAMLRQAGYEKLGAGLFATVYGKPRNPWVLKLFTPSDTAFLQFVKLCSAVQSPHLPVFKGQPVKVNDNYWGIRLERLKPAGAAWVKVVKTCAFYIGQLSLLRTYAGHSAEGINRDASTQKVQTFVDSFRLHNPDYAYVLDAIDKYILQADENAMHDIHLDNVGLRGNTLVFFDPVGAGGASAPAFLELDEEFNNDEGDGPTDDELQKIERDKIQNPDRGIRQMKAVAMPGNTSSYPAF